MEILHESYHSEKVLNKREYKFAKETAILTLSTMVQHDCNEMIMWLLTGERKQIESGRTDIHNQSFLCYSMI